MEPKLSSTKTYLSFKSGNELFATEVEKVLEIQEVKQITKLPNAPEFLTGVINLRGKVLPIVDLRIKFGLTATEYTKDTCIVVFNLIKDKEQYSTGVLVDAVSEVLDMDDNNTQAPPRIGREKGNEAINGMWKKDEGFIMLLDIDSLLNDEELLEIKNHQN